MSQKTLRDVLKESKEGRKILKKYNNNLDDYERSEFNNTVNNNDKNKEIAKKISKLMMKDPRVNHELKEKLPTTYRLKKNKLENLRSTAQGDGSRKAKRAAQKELDKIRDAREKNVNSGYESIDKTSYSEGRKGSKGWLARYISNKLIGSESHRTQEVATPDGAIEIDYKYDLKSDKKGHLHGYMFEPAQSNGKVVLVYSGGGAPAGNYIDTIAETYLKSGCKVVVMDYRGFGKSKTEDREGKEVDFQLGERSMYQDGEAMLAYVQKKLKYSNSNIILHGYSLGGAVASKVAANLAERNAVKRKDGKLVKEKDRLGGLVLHSAMGSNYKTSFNYLKDNDAGTVKAAGAGFLSWLFSGGFNTISHMKRLHKYDPKLRVHLVSGSAANNDHLNITKSGILPNNPYTTATTYTTEGGHTELNIVQDDRGLQNLIKSDRVEDNRMSYKKNMNKMPL